MRAPGGARVADLVAATGVAPMTVRRDLAELERHGVLRRVHGGATAVPARGEHLPYAVRLASHAEAKIAIARACAGLVPDGASVIVDDGCTCAAVARELAGRDLTVLAMSIHVAAALGARAGTRILTPGGRLDPDELSWVGATAVDAVRAFRADAAVLGVCGWDVRDGLTSSTPADAEIKRAVIGSTARTIAVATGEKFERSATFVVCPSEAIDVAVVDRIDEAARAALENAGVEVVVASVAPPRTSSTP